MRIIRLILMAMIFLTLPLAISQAGLTPGFYIYQSQSGQQLGTIDVTLSTASYQNLPVTAISIHSELNIPKVFGSDKIITEEVAYINKAGLQYFKKETTEKDKTSLLEGRRESHEIQVWVRKGDFKMSIPIPLKSFDMSEYEMELPQSRFNGMKLMDGRSARIFYVDTYSVIRTVRNVNDHKIMSFNDKDVDTLVINTNAGGKVTTSWFEVGTHTLLKEMGLNYQIIRVDRDKKTNSP